LSSEHLPHLAAGPVEAFVIALHFSCQFYLQIGFGFPDIIPATLDSSSQGFSFSLLPSYLPIKE